MNVQDYSKINFRHAETGYEAGMVVLENRCRYYYLEAEPIWHMDMSHYEANKMFKNGYWKFIKGESR